MKTLKMNPIRFFSILTGTALLIMALAAGYAYGISFTQIHVENDPIQTMTNIQSNSALFYSGAAAWGLILAADLLVAYGLYRYLKSSHLNIAIFSGMLRLLYCLFLAIGIVFLFRQDTHLFEKTWSLGLFIFGFHLIVTGIGVLKNEWTPSIFAYLLLIAGIGYSLIHGLENFMPQAAAAAAFLDTYLSIPMAVGELSFAVWLLVKGGKSVSPQPLVVPDQDAL